MYGVGGATKNRAAGIPFAVIPYSGDSHYNTEPHAYRYWSYGQNKNKSQYPLAAYCYVAQSFPDVKVQANEPLNMAHLKLNNADFVVEALYTLSKFVQEAFGRRSTSKLGIVITTTTIITTIITKTTTRYLYGTS